jgi:heme-degrading monooxygenase HmoA
MILERAQIPVTEGEETAFEAAITQAKEVISQSPGFRSIQVFKGVERPSVYLLLIEWDTLEDHTVGFRESERFVRWRELIGPFFASPPEVEHFDLV